MVDKKVIDEWLKKADEDLEFACSVIDESTFYAQICFHFHQSAEKYLKSFIIANELEFKKIHDLLILLKSCTKINPQFQELTESCKFLNRFYIDTRYPVHWATEYDKTEAKNAQNAAMQIRNFIKMSLQQH
jgi:HEPN domain-containing protein